jgi:hypothetical protein
MIGLCRGPWHPAGTGIRKDHVRDSHGNSTTLQSNQPLSRHCQQRTDEHAFQELKAKDLRADLIVWIHFGKRFQQGTGKIGIWFLRNPARYIRGPCRLDIQRLKARVGTTDDLTFVEFDSLDELLSDNI